MEVYQQSNVLMQISLFLHYLFIFKKMYLDCLGRKNKLTSSTME